MDQDAVPRRDDHFYIDLPRFGSHGGFLLLEPAEGNITHACFGLLRRSVEYYHGYRPGLWPDPFHRTREAPLLNAMLLWLIEQEVWHYYGFCYRQAEPSAKLINPMTFERDARTEDYYAFSMRVYVTAAESAALIKLFFPDITVTAEAGDRHLPPG